MNKLIKSIVEHEGFVSKPYPDPLHGWAVPTFGHGLTYITEEESIQLVKNRVNKIELELLSNKSFILTNTELFAIVTEMSYQMGVKGCLAFKKMWAAIEVKDYETAAKEMLDSTWAKQTYKRAHTLSERMRKLY